LKHQRQEFTVDFALKQSEKAILVGLVTLNQSERQLKEYFDELEFLASTAGAETVDKIYQRLDRPDPRTYVGSGKLQEIKKLCEMKDADVVIFDDEITPSQQNNIEKELQIKVLDRSMLILDIFSQRAMTVQAKTQVELAQTQYLLPRLKGLWTHLDRIKGGIGQRGTGEKEIETDRRIAKDKISKLKDKLIEISKQNLTQRKNRGEMIRVALVGYTNVGKSTIMNVLSKANILAENKLFATLDTTVRKVVINNMPFLLSDTVGFIRKLPHHLVESFKSTLDEATESDIILHIVDISHPQYEDQMKVVNTTLSEMKIHDKPTIVIFNKMDQYENVVLDEFLLPKERKALLKEMKNSWIAKTNDNCLFVSAILPLNMDEFRNVLIEKIKTMYLDRYPHKARFVWGYGE
jgi:GTPase